MTVTETTPNNSTRPLGQLLLGIIDKPAATFQAVLASPRKKLMWIVPLLIITAAFVALIVIQSPYTVELAREQSEKQLATLPPAQADMARQQTEVFLSLPFLLTTTLIVGLITLAIAVLAQSAFFYFAAMLAGGADMNFGAMFTVSVWTRLPAVVAAIVQAAFILATKKIIQYPGLSALVSSGDLMIDAKNPLVPLLGSLDLFWLWQLFLIVVGVGIATRLSRVKTVLLTVVYAALALGFTVTPTLLTSLMQPK